MEWNVKTLRIKRQQLKSVDGGSAHHSTIALIIGFYML